MFKDKFKYFKRKVPPPDFSSLIDLTPPYDSKIVQRIRLKSEAHLDLNNFGLINTNRWELFEIVDHPGLIVLKNPFTPSGQRYWIRKCLEDYSRPPNKNNLLQHGLLSETDDWWQICQNDPEVKEKIYKQLRWVTLGYHHNWDTKVYSESLKTEFPTDLYNICKILGKSIGNWEVEAQAAIVNYYHLDSTLSGHTDHSEPNNSAPLFSFSFGQSAIFLIGGPKMEDNATGILVRSGDIIVMSLKSRLSYHGVPRVLKTYSKPWLDQSKPNGWEDFENYVSQSRINLNVRQVLFPGQIHL